MRKLGIRFLSSRSDTKQCIPAEGMSELYDVATGEAFDGIADIVVKYRAGDVISADIKIYVQEIDGKLTT